MQRLVLARDGAEAAQLAQARSESYGCEQNRYQNQQPALKGDLKIGAWNLSQDDE
jgi:hypothetical protein